MCLYSRGDGLQSWTRIDWKVYKTMHVFATMQVAIAYKPSYCLILHVFLKRFTKDCPTFKEDLDVMKFLCKEFWSTIFKKQIDNLRTNHQVWQLNYVFNMWQHIVEFSVTVISSLWLCSRAHTSCKIIHLHS